MTVRQLKPTSDEPREQVVWALSLRECLIEIVEIEQNPEPAEVPVPAWARVAAPPNPVMRITTADGGVARLSVQDLTAFEAAIRNARAYCRGPHALPLPPPRG